jgi:hypothetical protein
VTDTQEAASAPVAQKRPANAIPCSCGAWWTGLTRSHCPACHRTFSVDSAADRHRKGAFGKDRRCVDPATVGLVAVKKPYGLLWQNPAPAEGERVPGHWDRTPPADETPAEAARADERYWAAKYDRGGEAS